MQDFKIAHQHTQKPTTPKGGDHHACQMLATTIHKSNTTPHHQSEATTSPIPGFPHSGRRDSGPVVSKPNSVSGSPSPASITRNPYRLNVCRAPEPHPLQVRPIQRIAQGHRTPTPVGGPQVSWCSLERR